MSDPDYRVLSVILCEEIRNEQGGKQSLLGVFDGELIVPGVPAVIARLSFRVAVQAGKTSLTDLAMRVISITSGTQVFEVRKNLEKPGRPKNKSAFGFSFTPAILPDEGEYTIEFALNDFPLVKISGFSVRVAKSKEEKRLLNL